MPANGLGTNSRSNSHDLSANVSSSSTSTSTSATPTTTTSRRIDLDPKMQQQINAILGESSPTGFSSPGSLSPGAPPPRSSLSLSATPRHSRIAIIGSGISGIGAASKLVAAGHRVVIYEKGDHVGGHAHTELVDGNIPVDIGFQVFNQVTYPNMVQWFTEHNVEMEVSDMSLAVSMNDGCLEWSSSGLNGLLAQRSNIANPSFLAMIRDLTRFQNDVETFLKEADTAPSSSPLLQLTMSNFLTSHHYSSYFQHYYILPVCAAIWSCPSRTCLNFPAYFIFTFMRNHHLLQLTNRPQWLTVKGRSQDGYIRKVCAPFWDSIRLNTEVVSVISTPSTPTAMGSSHVSSNTLTVVDASGHHEVFDHVILACHAPDAIHLLGKHITDDEHRILRSFHYQSNDVVLHHDTRLMPRSDRSWASWNFMGESTGSSQGVCVTYWINRLQNIPTKQNDAPILVTLNPIVEPDAKKIVKRFNMSHPVPSQAAVAAQQSLHEIQGKRHIWFAGAYAGWGFHEDGLVAGFKVAAGILHSSWQPLPYTPQFQLSLTQLAAQQIVHSFLRSFIKHGYLTLRQLGGSIETFGTKTADTFEAHVVIHNAAFYTKILLRADLGIPDAYIAGDITCHDMLSFLRLLLSNRDDESNRSHGRMNYSQLITASMARTTSYLWHQWNKRNTPKQSRENIASHYDLGNDFFRLFLDPSMSYSCGMYRTPTDTLIQAQLNKWDTLITKARIRSTHRILEIGFGWGALSIMIAKRYGCRVTGITLSSQQLEYASKRVKEEKLSHLIDYHLIDYRLFQPGAHKFDRILSCEMLEAVGHEFYPDFYRHCDRMLTPDGLLVVQAITYPDSSYDEYRTSIDFIKESIFPGGLCPSLSALTEAMKKASTFMIEAVENIGPDYARTLADWRANFHANRHLIKALGSQYTDEFMRKWDYYFVYCQAGFASRALSTLQIVYTRPGNTRSLV